MATRFWVGGTGNWDASTTTNWSATSGGAGGASVPTSSDTVTFDTLSNATAYTVTVTATANCSDISFGNPLVGALTFAGSQPLNVYGNFTIVSTITRTYTGTITFRATTTGKTITTNAVTLASSLTFNGVGGGWTLQDALTSGTANTLSMINGTLATNSNPTTIGKLTLLNSGTATTLTLGSETFTLTGTASVFDNQAITTTFNCGTSTISVTDTSASLCTLSGGNTTFYNFHWNRGASTGGITIVGNNIFNEFKDNGTAAHTLTFPSNGVQSAASFTFTGSVGNVLTVRSSTAQFRCGLKQTTGGGTFDYLSLTDVAVGGGATWTAGANSTFVSGNEGWTDQPATPTRYWVAGGTGNWNSTTNWSSSSGGASGASVPTSDMDVVFNSSSGSGTATVNATATARDFTCTGFTGTIAGSSTLLLYRNVVLGGTYTYTGTVTHGIAFLARTFTSNSKVLTTGTHTFALGIGGSMTLQDDLTTTGTGTSSITSGTLDLNNFNFTCGSFGAGNVPNVRELKFGSGSLILTASGTVWSPVGTFGSLGLTITVNTGTIKMTNVSASDVTFSGQGLTYNNVWFSRSTATGTNTVAGSNTFADFKDDGTVAHSILFTAGTTQTLTSFTVNGGGSPASAITINSTTTATHTLSKASGTVTCDWLNIQHSVATGGATWNATNSIDNQSVASAGSGWNITPPEGLKLKTIFGMTGAVSGASTF